MNLLLIDQQYRVDSLCQGIECLQCHSQGLLYATWVTPCPRWYTNARTLAHRAATQSVRVFFFVEKISPARRADNHSSCCIAVLCLALTACGGGYYTSKVNGEKKVYRVDEQGTKILVCEIDPNGQTTIHDTQDPMAKRQVAAQEMAEQILAKKAAQIEALSAAQKWQAKDSIYVNLAPPVLDGRMQQAEKPKGAVAQQIRNEFASDPIIKLVAGKQSGAGFWQPSAASPIADVEVSSKVSIKEVYGVNRRTGKPGTMVAIVFEATITSQVPPASYTVSESGHVLQNVEVSKRFAKQIKQVIVEKIGTDIPAN